MHHYKLQPTVELSMGVYGRDLGHISVESPRCSKGFGTRRARRTATGYPLRSPASRGADADTGSKIVLSGEYTRMRETFRDLASASAWPCCSFTS